MRNSAATELFVFLLCFWTLMTILSNVLNVSLSKTDTRDFMPSDVRKDDPQLNIFPNNLFGFFSQVPFIKYFVPLAKIMLFQYSSEVPVIVSIFLNITALLTAYLVLEMFRK